MGKVSTFFNKAWDFFARPGMKFREKHPEFYDKHRDLIGSCVCGALGAIVTYLLVNFMPYIFGWKMAEIEFMVPKVKMQYEEIEYYWSIIGFEARYRDGELLIGGGLAYTISYYFANIASHAVTFFYMRKFHHSKQNPYKQYFIGLGFCLSVTILSNMINGLWLPILYSRLVFLAYNTIVIGVIGFVNFIIGHISNVILYKDRKKSDDKEIISEEITVDTKDGEKE